METPIYDLLIKHLRYAALYFSPEKIEEAERYYEDSKIYSYKNAFHEEYVSIIKSIQRGTGSLYFEFDNLHTKDSGRYKLSLEKLSRLVSKEYESALSRCGLNTKDIDDDLLSKYMERFSLAECYYSYSIEEERKHLELEISQGAKIDIIKELKIIDDYRTQPPVKPNEFLCIYFLSILRLKGLVDFMKKDICDYAEPEEEPICVDGLLYPEAVSHKLLILEELGIIHAIRSHKSNINNENLGKLLVVLLGIKDPKNVRTLIKGLSDIHNETRLKTDAAIETADKILFQFGIKRGRK